MRIARSTLILIVPNRLAGRNGRCRRRFELVRFLQELIDPRYRGILQRSFVRD